MNNERILQQLTDILTKIESLPFLFIGSGFTRRYLDAPDWTGLLKEFCTMIDSDNGYLYNQYQEEARQALKNENKNMMSVNALNSKIADIIEDNFNLIWFKEDRFKQNREESGQFLDECSSPLKIELANYFNKLLEKPCQLASELDELKKLSSNSIAGIITTNYDNLLEHFFSFDKYIGQEQLIFSNTLGICEIYKIHGCSSDPCSLIINSNDYENFEAKNKYLAAKLLTIFVEHPIIFIGYSIQDENIRGIIDAILDCLNDKQLLSFKERFIFIDRLVDSENDEIRIEEAIYSSHSGKTMQMTKVYIKNYGKLYEILSHNKSKYPTKVLKRLKKDIYELVTSTQPTDKLKVMVPIEDLDTLDNVEFVVGVGISKATDLAYASFSAEAIYKDIVFDNGNFIPNLLVDNTMPPHLSRTSGSMPFYKYLKAYNGEMPRIYNKYIKTNIDDLYNNSIKDTRKNCKQTSVEDIKNTYDYPQSLYYMVRLDPKYIDTHQLRNYLSEILTIYPNDINTGNQYPHSSDLRRLIKILDWLDYKQ